MFIFCSYYFPKSTKFLLLLLLFSKIFRLRRAKMYAIFYSKIATIPSENPQIFRLRRAKMHAIFYCKIASIPSENPKFSACGGPKCMWFSIVKSSPYPLETPKFSACGGLPPPFLIIFQSCSYYFPKFSKVFFLLLLFSKIGQMFWSLLLTRGGVILSGW